MPEDVARVVAPIDPSASAPDSRSPGAGLLAEVTEQDIEAEGPQAPAAVLVEVEHYTARNWGGRHENEDRVMNHKDELPESQLRFHTVGVLDGHDTEVASDLVSSRLPHEVGRWLKQGCTVVEAYTRSMEALEDQLKAVTSSAGTCCLSCTIAGRFLWCSNLGDCRAILVPLAVPEPASSGHPGALLKPKVTGITWMSRDHKASSPEEKRRIERAGGQVMDGRVEGLEPSRTLGDFDVKLRVAKNVVSIVPEVRRHEFVPNGSAPAQAVLVCATDGVWDVLNGHDICNLIIARKDICGLQTAMASESARPDRQVLKLLAEDLVQFSIAKGSRDDCTAICALISVPADSRRESFEGCSSCK